MPPAKKTSTASRKPAPTKKKEAPWDCDNPKARGEHTHLTLAEKAEAKRHAKAAGRPYPNLVDNLQEARKHHEKEAKGKG